MKNTGQQEMYYIENDHEPIIDRETWMQAQERKGMPLPEYMWFDKKVEIASETSEIEMRMG